MGNLVDDTVVEVENMERHISMGKSAIQAAIDSSAEVGLAVIASSATIIAVFLPVAFMGGIPGQFFQPFGVTVAVSTLFSTLVARTITPMLGANWFKAKTTKQVRLEETRNSRRRFQPYRQLLSWALSHRLTTIAIAIAFFIGSLALIPLIPKGFVDNGDLGLSTVSIELPPGSTLADTKQVVTQATDILRRSPAVKNVLATQKVDSATLNVNLQPKEARNLSQVEYEQQMPPAITKKFLARELVFKAKGRQVVVKI